MITHWLVILPPLIVLINAYLTQHLNRSLLIGLLSAALIFTDGNPLQALKQSFFAVASMITDSDNIFMYLFLIAISALIILLERTGGARAFAHALTARLGSARAAESASLGLSSTLFIDDYLSTLTTGHVMRPITDRFAIPRAKLAWLIHSFSGPLVILVPITSWLTMITTNLDQVGVSALALATTTVRATPIMVYLHAIPYIFYSLLVIASTWFIVVRRISYGPMHTQEEIAATTGNLNGGKDAQQQTDTQPPTPSDSIADLVVPLLILLGSAFLGIFYALTTHSSTSAMLCLASVITFSASSIIALGKHQITKQQLPSIIREGFLLIVSAIIMLILVGGLGSILKNDLHTGDFLANAMIGTLSPHFLPLMFFVVAATCSLMMGSSWGTISLLMPIAVPMLIKLSPVAVPINPSDLPLLFPLLGAIFSGAVCGDHLSPISQTTIMAALSAGCSPLDHVITQFPYALPALVCSALAFFLVGFLSHLGIAASYFIALCISMIVTLASITTLNYLQKRD